MRNSNDPRRWRQENRGYGPKQSPFIARNEPSLNHSDFSRLEQTKIQAATILPSFQNENRNERSPSIDKPSTSTVNKTSNTPANLVNMENDLSAQIKLIRKAQTEAKFEERNVDLTENCGSDFQERKHALEDGEITDFMNKKKFKPSEMPPIVLPKFRLSKASRNEIRAL